MIPHDTARLGPLPEVLRSASRGVESISTPAGDRMWLVRDYALARFVLSDRRFSRAEAAAAGAPRFVDAQPVPQSVMSMDGTEHARLRRITSRAFAETRIQALAPLVEELVDEQLEAMVATGPPYDFAAGLAAHLPLAVMCGLLGIPSEETDRFKDCVGVLFDIEADPADGARRRLELVRYMTRLFERKRLDRGDDLLSLLISEQEAGGMTHNEMVTMGLTLLMAGFESTIRQIGLSVLCLLTDPELARVVTDEPDAVRDVVEELLRLDSASMVTFPRVATAQVEIGDVTVRAGEAVVVPMPDANRAAAASPDPERPVLRRSDAPHLAFGYGTHRCLGAPLARLQLRTVLAKLFAAFPTLRLADAQDAVAFKDKLVTRGLVRLLVTWDGDHARH